MNDDSQSELEALKAALAAEKEAKFLERFERIENSIESIAKSSEAAEKTSRSVKELDGKLASLTKEVAEVKKRVPPLQTTATVVFVALGLLGWQVKDIFQARSDITNLKKPVTEAVATLKEGARSSDGLIKAVNKSLGDVDSSLAESRQLLAKYNDDISGTSTRVARFEEKLSKLSMQLNLLIEQVGRQSSSIPSVDHGSSNPESILDFIAERIEGRGDSIALLAKATLALRREQYRDARALAIEAKAKHSGEPESAFDILIAQSYHMEGEYQNAVGAFEKANEIASGEEKVSILSNMGASYFAWAQTVDSDEDRKTALLEKAVEIERQSRNLTKTVPAVYVNGVVTLNALGRHSEALGVLEEYRGPESGEVEFAFANTFALLGRKAKALDKLSSALKLNRSLAMNALLDDDFEGLRPDPEFVTILLLYLPKEIIEEAKRQAW